MSTHNICFYGEIMKIIPNYPQIPSLSVSLVAWSLIARSGGVQIDCDRVLIGIYHY